MTRREKPPGQDTTRRGEKRPQVKEKRKSMTVDGRQRWGARGIVRDQVASARRAQRTRVIENLGQQAFRIKRVPIG